jgi:hypothetical protein
VPGLAEGRPSVLRGDLVTVTWKGSLYKGRVVQTRLLEVLMELHPSFHRKFSDSLDTVDVRFTFSRTTFRTCHEGSAKALEHMGEHMLAPKHEHEIVPSPRSVPRALRWANSSLNDEQRATVFHILKGQCRPVPYIVFGPPGTVRLNSGMCFACSLVRVFNSKGTHSLFGRVKLRRSSRLCTSSIVMMNI